MNYTTNYQLPQWVKEDRIMMEDFNDMTAKVDEALGEHEAKLIGVGNCIVKWGNYTGNGAFGSGNPTILSFDNKPMLIVLYTENRLNSANDRMILLQGVRWGFSSANTPNSLCVVNWSDNQVSWYSDVHQDFQYSTQGIRYYYVAFLLAEE